MAFAKKKAPLREVNYLKIASLRYKKSEMTTMKVEKTVKSDLMGSENKLIGKIAISSGLFRWENSEPEKSLLIFDGENLWNEQSAPKDFPGPAQVVKAKVDKKNQSQILVGALLGQGAVAERFKVLSEKSTSQDVTYIIEPKDNDPKIKQLEVRIEKKSKEVVGISYNDDVGNMTTMTFSEIEFNKKKNPQLFKYRPPAGAQVTNL